MFGLDAPTIAASNLVQVIRSKTAQGFVPNFSSAGQKSLDRTEPMIGAKVLRVLHDKYAKAGGEYGWVAELLLDDLLDWSD